MSKVSLSHDGTDSVLSSNDNSGSIIIKLGSDTDATDFQVKNNSETKSIITAYASEEVVLSSNLTVLGTTSGKTTVTALSTSGNITYTALNIHGGYIRRDPNGANRSDTFPNASSIITSIKGAATGSSFEFVIENTSDAAETITMNTNTGLTLVGTMTISANERRRFKAWVSNLSSSTVSMYDLGATGNYGPGGSNTQVQYNNNGTLGGDSNLTYNGTKLIAAEFECTGQTTIGASSSNSVYFNGRLQTGITPKTDNTYDLGERTLRYRRIHVGDSIRFPTNNNDTWAWIKDCVSYNSQEPRGLQIGHVDIHTGSAGTGSLYIGVEQGENSSTRNHITTVGYRAGGRSPGADSTLFGYEAGRNLQADSRTVNDMVCIGSDVIGGGSSFISDFHDSVLIGSTIGVQFRTGANCVFIGSNEKPNSQGGTGNVFINTGNSTNVTTGDANVLIGGVLANGTSSPVHNPNGSMSNCVGIGSTAVTNAYIKVAWTVTSDSRDKNVSGDAVPGLDFVDELKPVKYQFKKGGDRSTGHGDGIDRYGFLAQDVADIEGDDTVLVNKDDPENLKMTQEYMVPILVNAIKELKQEVQELKLLLNNTT